MRRLSGIALSLICLPVAHSQVNPDSAKLTAIGLLTADREAQTRFWTELLPCGKQGPAADCNGVTVNFRGLPPSGGSAGSVINHIGFFVPNMEDYVPKVAAAGHKYTRTSTGIQIIIDGPDGVRVELTSDPNAKVRIRFHHVHFSTPDPKAMQAWYAKFFGAVPGKRAQWDAGDLPNANLTYAQANGPVEPTAGRAIESISFIVDNVHESAERLRSAGVKVEEASFYTPAQQTTSARCADPWGTSITLAEAPK